MTPKQPQSRLPASIRILVVANFIVSLGYGVMVPVIPQFAQAFGVSLTAASVVISAYAASRLVFAPLSGWINEKVSPTTAYIAGLLVVAVTTGGIAFTTAYWQMITLRVASGLGSTVFTVAAAAYIAKHSPPSRRGEAAAAYSSAWLIGTVFGPVLGALMSGLGLRAPFLIYAFAIVCAALLAVRFIPRHLPAHSPAPPASTADLPPLTLREAWGHASYRAAIGSSFAHGWSNLGARISLLPLFAATLFERGAAVSGLAMAAFGIGNALGLFLTGRLSDSIGRRPVILVGLISGGLFTAVIGLSTSPWLLLLLSGLAGLGAAGVSAPQQAAIADVIGPDRPGGRVLSTAQMTQDFGQVIGPIVAGYLADQGSFRLAFAVCGVILVLAAAGWLRVRDPKP